jgi:hypothetical protein
MFKGISWQGYWTTLALLTAGYYFVVYLRYFRKVFNPFARQQESAAAAPAVSPAVASFLQEQTQGSLFPDTETQAEFSLPTEPQEQAVYACLDEVSAYFAAAKKAKVAKAEVLFALGRILQKYPSLQTSEYQDSVNNVLQAEAEHHCSVHFSAEEMRQVWSGP